MLPNNFLSSITSCKTYNRSIPNFDPVILSLTPDVSTAGQYTQVNVFGKNFSFGSKIGYTIIRFENIIIPVTYYGSNNISFIVPASAGPGEYNIQAVNAFYPNSSYSNVVNFKIV